MSVRVPRRLGLAVVAALLATISLTAFAQGAPRAAAEPEQLIDWYYASTFGTGVYRIGDRTVTVLRLPLSRVLRESDDDTWGVRLKLPVTFGLYNLSTVVEDVANRNLATLAAMPGIEFEKEVAHNWVLKPTASFGGAYDFARGDRSTLWELGVRSVWSRSFQRVDFSLGNALLYAGNVASDGLSQRYGVLATGLNFIVPTGGRIYERVTNIGFHAIHYAFFNRLEFLLGDRPPRSITNQFELAMTFGTYQPLRVFGFDVERVGLAVRVGDEFFAVRLVSGFLY